MGSNFIESRSRKMAGRFSRPPKVLFIVSIYFHHSFDHSQESKNHFLAAYLTGDLEVLDFCLQVDHSAGFCAQNASTKRWKMLEFAWFPNQASAGKHGQRSFIAIAQETIECSLQSLKAGGLDLLPLSFL